MNKHMTKTGTLAAIALLAAGSMHAASTKENWGTMPDGKAVELYTLNDGELTVTITNFGAHVVSIDAPDRAGKKADVVLGYKDLGGYLKDTSTYLGSVVGRYGNRIAKGAFTLDGKTYQIPTNNNGNALHGGTVGFDRKVWTGRLTGSGVDLTYVSADGEMGFPGKLTAHVRYTLEGRSLHIEYSATTDKDTVVNLTNHSYFNLGGEDSGDILGEKIMINADRYTPVDAGLIPTGKLPPVAGTPFDFKKATAIGARIDANDEQLKLAGGYDHNFVLNGGSTLHVAAKVEDPKSGRTLTVTTTEPGVQFYSGNFLDGTMTGVGGKPYGKHAGFCLETQHFPDSPNQPAFPSTELKPGQTMRSTTIFTFGVEK
jgi:aldose 1-epimerase